MILSIVALTGAVVGGVLNSGPFVIVQKGLAKASIVLSPNATVPDLRAAEILQSSIREMSGAVLPIGSELKSGNGPLIEIGFPASPSEKLGVDAFSVEISTQTIRISSGGRKGSVYAVVDILEKFFGCRYYSLHFHLFPNRDTLVLSPQRYSDSPVNSFRAINGDFDADPNWLDWQRLNDTNEMFGKGFYVHTFHRLVPPETFFQVHPEYFAVINGKRDPSQLCPSRAENVEIAVETLKKAMAEDPDKPVWSVSQNDNEEYCHCPECLKAIQEEGSPAGPILRFVNAIARRFPNKTISTLAYEFSRSAPKVTKPDPNVQIMLCTIELTRTNPIAVDPTCAGFRNDIVNWGKICHNIYLWDYTVDFSHQVAPFPNIPVLQPNIQFFVRNHARQHFQQSNTSPGHEFSELKSYLIARLLWNPDADTKSILRDFMRGYYGKAAPYVQAYISALENNLHQSGARLDIFGSPISHVSDFLSAPAVSRYNKLFDQAEAAVSGDPSALKHVKVARLAVQYAALTVAADQVFGPRGFFTDQDGVPKLRPEMAKTLDDFAATCANNGVRSVNESNLSPNEFCDAMRRLLELEMDGNLAFRKPVSAIPAPSTKYGHGDISLLTNGVHGANDFNVQWLGWEGTDFDVVVDLGQQTSAREAKVDSLSAWRSWILHPKAISCFVSSDGVRYLPVGAEAVEGDEQHQPLIRSFVFKWEPSRIRYVKLHVAGTLQLPSWHSAAGGKSWVFLDEVTVR